MQKEDRGRKIFKGYGVALGGYIERPDPEVIRSQASASIPITGGRDSARVEGFNHRDIVSFKSAYTMVSGHESADGKYLETLVTSVVEGLDILGVLTADRIVARLGGSHEIAPKKNAIVTPSGSHFHNLQIYGRPVHCDFIGECFDNVESGAKTLDTIRGLPEFKGKNLISDGVGWSEKGFLCASICSDLKWGGKKCPGTTFIEIPHFGRVYLGEFIVSRDSHHLTMLRVELGCTVSGDVTSGTGGGEPHLMP